MTTTTDDPGALDRQLRAAADQEVRGIPGATVLGDGDFARVRSRVSGAATNMEDRIRLAASYAREIAIANRDEPRNLFDGRGPKQDDSAPGPHGWHGLGAHTHALWRGRSGSNGGGDGEGSGEKLASGARFDGVNAGSGAAYWGSPAGLAQMRELAVKSGVGWMASNEGLLKLGPEAVKAVAQAHLKEGGYKILKGDLHMNDKEVVAGARYAVRNKVNLDEIAHASKQAIDGLPRDDGRLVATGVKGLLTSQPGAEEARRKTEFNQMIDQVIERNPTRRKELDGLRAKAGAARRAENAAVKTAGDDVRLRDAKRVTADAKTKVATAAGAGNDSLLASLNNGDAGSKSAPVTTAKVKTAGGPKPGSVG